MLQNNKNLKIPKKLLPVVLIFGFLSFYGFNCAPPSFKVAEQESLVLTPAGIIDPVDGKTSPSVANALLTSQQIYHSFLNLTDQAATPTNTQVQEFEIREGSFSVSSDLNFVNSPMMIAVTSFAGEVCNGLVEKEIALPAASRKYFNTVNFSGAISALDNGSYGQVVTKLANGFWGRAPSSDEVTLFNTFKTDFVAAIPAAQATQTAQTRALVLSACTAMLSSFDVFTY